MAISLTVKMKVILVIPAIYLLIIQISNANPAPPPTNFLNYQQIPDQHELRAELKEFQFKNGSILLEEISVSDANDDGITYRLPNNTRPVRYDIWVSTEVHKADFKFEGRVKIQISANEITDYVILQYRDITIDKIDLLDVQSSNIVSENLSYKYLEPKTHEFLKIELPESVNFDSQFILDITYHGELHEADSNGFYKAFYKNAEGETVWYATTKFEPHHARHLMPCYDEPAIRAPIGLQVQHDKSYNTYSNMPLEIRSAVDGSDFVVSKFQDTPPMQTYLLAFLVSAFKYISNNDVNVEQRIFAKPQSIDDGDAEYAASISDAILKKFEELLKIKYPLPKLDHVAITQFPSGAMENFGFITYRESYLLVDKSIPPILAQDSKKNIARIMAHEVAHQWFGNTVAPQWWTHLWLNEGFATLYQYLIPHLLFPNLGFYENFRTSCLQESLLNDIPRLAVSVPMSHYVESPSAIRGRFNIISYQKSGTVLMMFMEALGLETFHAGLNKYLNDNYFGVGVPSELFKAIQTSYGDKNKLDIEAVMSTWTTQAGYPILHVEKFGNKLKFTQHRYPTGSEIFSIPLTFVTKSSGNLDKKTVDYWIHEKEEEVDVDVFGLGDTDWIIFNNQQVGYYRVGYSDELWKNIANGLSEDSEKIHLINRRILQEELQIGMTVSNNIHASSALAVIKTLVNEKNHLVWNDANKKLIKFLHRMLFNTNAYANYIKLIQTITKPILDTIGFEPAIESESKDIQQLRLHVKSINCKAFDEDCMLHENLKLINYFRNGNENQIPAWCEAFRLADKEIYDHYLHEVITNVNFKNRNSILDAIYCSLNPDYLGVLIEVIEDKKNVLNSDERTHIINSMLISSTISFNVAFDYVRRNVEEIHSFLPQITIATNTQETFDELKLLLSEALNDKIMTHEQVKEIEAAIHEKIKWHEKHFSSIRDFFGLDGTTTIKTATETSTLMANGILVPFYLIIAALLVNYFM